MGKNGSSLTLIMAWMLVPDTLFPPPETVNVLKSNTTRNGANKTTQKNNSDYVWYVIMFVSVMQV